MQTTLPRVIVTGIPRAGSTRLYNLFREAMQAVNPGTRHGHRGTDQLLEAELLDPSPGLFKEHTFPRAVADRVRAGDLQAVATLRAPREVLISAHATFGWPPEIAVAEVEKALACLENIADAAFIYTYDVATDPNPLTVKRILEEVGVPVSLLAAARLSRRWSRRNSKKLSDARTPADGYDKVTLLHPSHVSKGRTLAPETVAELTALAAEHDFDGRVASLAARGRQRR
jgi:hypothetical protein